MIEIYAFLATFALQILATSVLFPTWFIRYVRIETTSLPAERLAQLYPDVDLARAQKRFLSRYRALHTCMAVLGSMMLIWLFNYLQRPDWDDGPVELLLTAYFMVAQMLPMGLLVWRGVRFDKAYKQPLPEGKKRKAVLERRGLFDFISPFAVGVAVLCYFLFAAFTIYLRRHPFPGFAGLVSLAIVTLLYAALAFFVYLVLYGRNKNSLQTRDSRLHAISVTVKSSVYTCIAVVSFLSLNFTLVLLDLQRWEPFALSLFFVICALLASIGVLSRKPTAAVP